LQIAFSNSLGAVHKTSTIRGLSSADKGEWGFFRGGRPNILVQKSTKFMACPQGQEGKGSPDKEGKSTFRDFVQSSFMDGLLQPLSMTSN